MKKIALFWFRRDLRLQDNAGLYHALKGPVPVLPVFIFDRDILDHLDSKDARVTFIHDSLEALRTQLHDLGSSMIVRYGRPDEIWKELLASYEVSAIYTNHDYEPYAMQRDEMIRTIAATHGIPLHTYKDQVIFEKSEVVKEDGLPYTVFTPYSRKWLAKLLTREWKFTDAQGTQQTCSYFLAPYPNERYFTHFEQSAPLPFPSLEDMGFERSTQDFPSSTVARSVVRNYAEARNFPALPGTSRLGIHFRFGTISIREKARHAQALSDTFLSELIWRDFYAQILSHFPHVVGHPFRAQYDKIEWRDAPEEFERWCKGKTGYPIVDAGMRELNTTGFMHNRVRMIVASFLSKHLLIDWRLGEAYFAEKLLDFDLASNSGGWQWAAGCGTDAAPYFRIFNPTEQTKKFDKDYVYIRKWVPEFGTPLYPNPMVDHVFARERCLMVYKEGLS